MSSTINVSALLASVAKMEAELAALKAQLGGVSVAASVKAPAEKKPRKKSDAPPTAWRLFTDRVRVVLKDNGHSGKDLGVGCVQFCATLKDENADFDSWADADILARRAAWSAPEVSKQKAAGKSWRKPKTGSAASSVVSAAVSEADGEGSTTDKPKKERKNPWAGLSPEDKAAKVAAMKAGRAAKKAAAATESATNAAPSLPLLPASPEGSVSSVRTGASEMVGFRKVTLGGKAYLINLESGHAYYRNADESRGAWAGLFSKTPKPHVTVTSAPPDEDFFSLLDQLDA